MKEEKKKKELSCCEKVVPTLVFIALGAVLVVAFMVLFMQAGQKSIDVSLSQDAANAICLQLTGEEFVIASDDYIELGYGHGGKLVCDVLYSDPEASIIVNK